MFTFTKKLIPLALILTIVLGPIGYTPTTTAQTVVAQLSPAERAQLEAELRQLEAELAQKQKELSSQKTYSSSLQGEINRLTSLVNAKKTEITLKSKKIAQLGASINEKKKTILTLSEKMENQKESLAQLIRKTDEQDRTTLTSFLVSSKNLSEFYSDVSRYDTLKKEVKDSVDQIKEIKGITETTKVQLEKEEDKTRDEKAALEAAQLALAKSQSTQKQLLSISKNKETEYQKVIADQQAKVANIKAKLFQLAGGSKAIRFDVALGYAEAAERVTGTPAALVLAILTQESALGNNVGQCYLVDTATGSSMNKNSGKMYSNGMKASRDVQPFLDITAKLGYDWTKTVVSCPIAGVAGYGGAMGPAQFIPSTWKLFQKRLESTFGRASNPWNAEDAFMASSMYLADLGATSSYSSQVRAACKYYGSGGATCSYGNSVMKHKANIQADIDYLKEYGVSRR